jgi:hypothetical protein
MKDQSFSESFPAFLHACGAAKMSTLHAKQQLPQRQPAGSGWWSCFKLNHASAGCHALERKSESVVSGET